MKKNVNAYVYAFTFVASVLLTFLFIKILN